MKNGIGDRRELNVVSIDKVALLEEHKKELRKVCKLKLFDSPPRNKQEFDTRLKNVDILLVNTFTVDKELLKLCKSLKLICVFGTGYDFIDVKEANKLGISVANTPGYSTESTAELAVYLMLGATRLASLANRNLIVGEWDPHKYCGHELKGKKLGIVGYGNIGRRIGQIAKNGFLMEVSYINSKSTKKDLHNLLRNSDIISINVPLTRKTENMISKEEFSIMKEGVYIINTSRGKVIDEKELIKALKDKKIAGGGFDVFSREPIDKNNDLLNMDNVILTPHMGFKSKQSSYRVSNIVKNNIISFINNKPKNILKI
ncbi:MAG: 2-hydroxyacid dehydrogenase [Candidatus Woesearchaeota archaeon]